MAHTRNKKERLANAYSKNGHWRNHLWVLESKECNDFLPYLYYPSLKDNIIYRVIDALHIGH